MSKHTDTPALVSTEEAFSAEELRAICGRIAVSGVLGRSKHYLALLEYLVDCSIANKAPKEIELATEVLGKPENFDVSADSSVRMYVHQLRKKLSAYYEQNELDAPYQLAVPKGKYSLAAVPRTILAESNGVLLPKFNLNGALLALAVVLLGGKPLLHAFRARRGDCSDSSDCSGASYMGHSIE